MERSGMMRCRPGIVTSAGACGDPGSAVQHFVLHRIRETQFHFRGATP